MSDISQVERGVAYITAMDSEKKTTDELQNTSNISVGSTGSNASADDTPNAEPTVVVQQQPDWWHYLTLAGTLATLIILPTVAQLTGKYVCKEGQADCKSNPLIKDDAVVLGILYIALAFIFTSANSPIWILKKFYAIIPYLFLCYFIPGLLGSAAVFDAPSSKLYSIASTYILPATLGLLCINIDLRGIAGLGPKAIIMFFVGSFGVIFGGPLSVGFMRLVWPSVVAGDDTWRGLTYIAGSWIGGGANAAAMIDIFQPSNEAKSQAIAVDIFCANVWCAVLFLLIGKRKQVNKLLRADPRPVDDLMRKMDAYEQENARIPSNYDLIRIACIAMGICGVANYLGSTIARAFGSLQSEFISRIAFDSAILWRVMIATMCGMLLSFTPARDLDGAGASKIANVFIYYIVVTIGMGMDITAIVGNPGIFVLGFIWICFHGLLMLLMCRLLRAPLFFMAVGSQANIGGAASAPVVAGAFHPSLAPVGALFAILGYVVGTWGAWLCSILMEMAATN